MARRSKQKVSHGLVAMSSAAVLAVYTAGYVRTRPAADRLARQTLARAVAQNLPPTRQVQLTPAPAPIPQQPKLGPAALLESLRAPAPAVQPAHAEELEHSVKPQPQTTVPEQKTEPSETPRASVPLSTAVPAPAAVETPSAPVVTTPAAEPQPAASTAPAAATATAPAPAPKTWKDGKYTAWGSCRHGDIQATVVIEEGRIVSAQISDCQTRYPCDIIDKLPPQVVKRQSPNVDRIGGATDSADAFYSAVYFALQQAK